MANKTDFTAAVDDAADVVVIIFAFVVKVLAVVCGAADRVVCVTAGILVCNVGNAVCDNVVGRVVDVAVPKENTEVVFGTVEVAVEVVKELTIVACGARTGAGAEGCVAPNPKTAGTAAPVDGIGVLE